LEKCGFVISDADQAGSGPGEDEVEEYILKLRANNGDE